MRALPRPDSRVLIPLAAAGLLLYLVGFPLAMLLLGSVSVEGEVTKGLTLANYIETYSSPRTYTLLLNSVLYSLGSSLLALTLGTGALLVVAALAAAWPSPPPEHPPPPPGHPLRCRGRPPPGCCGLARSSG